MATFRFSRKPEKHGTGYRVRVYHGSDRPVFETFPGTPEGYEEAEDFIRELGRRREAKHAHERADEYQRKADEWRAIAMSLENRSLTVREVLGRYEQSLRDNRRAQSTITSASAKIRGLC